MYNFKENESLYADIVDNGAPTAGTVGVVGQRYLDKQTSKYYLCVAADTTGPTYTWKEIGANTIIATTDPTDKTEGTVGQTYINTENGHYFVCTKVVEGGLVYVFKENITTGYLTATTGLSFISNGQNFTGIFPDSSYLVYTGEDTFLSVYTGKWVNEAYRTIEFLEAPPEGQFTDWLNANTTQNSTSYMWTDITNIKYYRHTITIKYSTITIISENSLPYTMSEIKDYLFDSGYIDRKYYPAGYSYYSEALKVIPVGFTVGQTVTASGITKELYLWNYGIDYETITINDVNKKIMKSINNSTAASIVDDNTPISDMVLEL